MPSPPLAEPHRIVAKIEELMTACASSGSMHRCARTFTSTTRRSGSSATYAGPTSEWLEERDVDAQLMKNGSASLSRVDEGLVEMQNG